MSSACSVISICRGKGLPRQSLLSTETMSPARRQSAVESRRRVPASDIRRARRLSVALFRPTTISDSGRNAHEARISVVSTENIKHLLFVEAAPFDDRRFSRLAAGRS